MAPSPDSPHFPFRQEPDFNEERLASARGLWPVAGVDEAGRGPLAGPVVAAAVILDPERIPPGLNDSKKVSARRRDVLFEAILSSALGVAFSSICAECIDRSDIRAATLEAMRRAVNGLCLPPRFVLADGCDLPPGLACPGKTLVGGDGRSHSIAAASIIAKVARDRLMARCGDMDGRYGFATHVGYGTVKHRRAITDYGAVPRLHRLTFAPLRKA